MRRHYTARAKALLHYDWMNDFYKILSSQNCLLVTLGWRFEEIKVVHKTKNVVLKLFQREFIEVRSQCNFCAYFCGLCAAVTLCSSRRFLNSSGNSILDGMYFYLRAYFYYDSSLSLIVFISAYRYYVYEINIKNFLQLVTHTWISFLIPIFIITKKLYPFASIEKMFE